jgi:hypothetical protein
MNATANGSPKYCECGAPGCNTKPVSPLPPCPRGTNLGRTHRFLTEKAVVPFGYGLSCKRGSYTSYDPAHPHYLSPTVTLEVLSLQLQCNANTACCVGPF